MKTFKLKINQALRDFDCPKIDQKTFDEIVLAVKDCADRQAGIIVEFQVYEIIEQELKFRGLLK
jgi:hypothetical protein